MVQNVMPQTMRFHDEFSTDVLPVFTHIAFSIHYSVNKEIRAGIILIFLLSLLILPRLILLNPLFLLQDYAPWPVSI